MLPENLIDVRIPVALAGSFAFSFHLHFHFHFRFDRRLLFRGFALLAFALGFFLLLLLGNNLISDQFLDGRNSLLGGS